MNQSGPVLTAAGLRVTRPRLAVLRVLDEAHVRREHLAVADVADRARRQLGALSTQAVYDVLQVLTEAGLARRVEPAGSPARFEARVGDNHHHWVCRSCGRVADVDCAVGAGPCLDPSAAAGLVVDEVEVVFWGRCPACAASAGHASAATSTSEEMRIP